MNNLRTWKNLLSGVLVTIGMLITTASANAAIVEFDFTKQTDFGGADGQLTFGPVSIGGVDVTLTSFFDGNGTMTFNSLPPSEPAGCASAGTSLACDGDGIGILGDANNDEIDTLLNIAEALQIDISSSYGFQVVSIEFLDLFEGEEADIYLDLNPLVTLAGSNTNGGYQIWTAPPHGPINVPISFVFATDVENSDFSVARLTLNVVPEPGTLALLGFGLAGMGFRIRRKKAYR